MQIHFYIINISDIYSSVQIKNLFSCFSSFQNVKMGSHGALLSLEVPGLSENRPSILRGDKIFVRISSGGDLQKSGDKEYEGFVHEIHQTKVLLGFSQELKDK